MTGPSEDTAGFRVTPEAADLTRIAAVTGELTAAESMEDVATVVASHVAAAVRASVSTLILRDGDVLRVVGHGGVADEKIRRWSTFGIDDANPASEAVRTGRPVVAATAAEVAARYPLMAADTPTSRSVVSLPLRAADNAVGVIGLTFERNWDPGPSELELMMTFADACAQTVRRVQATEAARVATEHLHFLARASAELGSSLDYRATLSRLAELAVPAIADWCAVDILADGALATLAVAHADAAHAARARRVRENYGVDMSAERGSARVVRTGVGELIETITDEMLVAVAQDDEHLAFLRELRIRSLLIAPLVARGQVLGTIMLARTESSPPFTAADLQLTEDLGRRAGVAIDNASLHADAVNVATQLRDAVMATDVLDVPGWSTAALYRADGRTEVGGDFYDSVALADGRLAVFIGDVAGHGLKAAAAMAHMRAAIRVLVTIDPEPEAVVEGLDATFDQLLLDRLVSLLYATFEPDGTVTLLSAGHCPPLVVGPGRSEYLPEASRPPIGAGRATSIPTTFRMDPGETMLIYTDGLIERRAETLDAGLARLAANAQLLAGPDLPRALLALVDAIRAADAEDDVAAVAVRRERA